MRRIKKNPIFNVLIIGAGYIGAFNDYPNSENILTHAHAFTIHKGFNLVGFVDKDIEKAKKAANLWSTSYFKTIEVAFKKFRIDVVCVAVPDDVHYPILMEILDYPLKFVFIEKPITKTLPEAKIIFEKYTSKKIPSAVNYSRRYVPEFLNIKSKILNGDYGNFLGGVGYYTKGLIHNGSHLLDLLRFLIGNVKEANPIQKEYDFYQDDPSISAVLNFGKNKFFFFKILDFRIYDIFEIDLLFEKKRLRLIDSGNKIEEYSVRNNPVLKRYKNLVKISEYKTSLNKAIYHAAQNIYDFLVEGKKIYCTLKDSYDVLKLCLELKKKI
ncbi:MAG: Gfo/Idh/MocA family oxidoreductase [Patescibacteria group bacterium]|nr:Gfo/Idh/MocA family oxidoreductase [Patescibacteria group bacterium]